MSSSNTTLARPYAKAAFEYALMHKALQAWSTFLQTAAAIISDDNIARVLHDPRTKSAELAEFILEVCRVESGSGMQNFIKLLTVNRRLSVLPDIERFYEIYRSEVERQIDVKVTSAFPLTSAEQKQIAETLESQQDQRVVLHCDIDKTLLGGAVIRMGDVVIDGSVRGKLARLATAMRG